MPDLPPPPRLTDDLPLLREDLAAAGYTVDGVTERLGDVAARALARDQAVPARRVLGDGDDPVGVLVRLFTLGDEVPAPSAEAALPRTGVQRAVDLGLLRRTAAGVRAQVDLQPHAVSDDLGEQGWWVCSDLGELAHGGGVLPTDHVLGVGAASTTLVEAVVPPLRGQRCLDVGAGSGVQSLHLSRTGAELVATDLSERACAFARVTAALNGVGLDVRAGSLLEPVRDGERFDRVVANLPFVVTPRGDDVPTYTYRDAGMAGDDVVRRMLLQAPLHLAPGGLAQFLGNWEDRADQDWQARLGGWVEQAAEAVSRQSDGADVVDVWVVQRELADPAVYAEAWISDGGRPDPERADAWYRAWLADFDARGVEAVGFGIVTVRRRSADPATPPLRRLDPEHATIPGAWRDVLAAGLTGHDALGRVGAHADVGALLDTRPVVAPGVVERRELAPGAVDPLRVHLVDTRRRGRVVEASTALAGLVGASDGELSVRQVVAALAQLLEEDEASLRAGLLPAVRDLVAEGLLVLP